MILILSKVRMLVEVEGEDEGGHKETEKEHKVMGVVKVKGRKGKVKSCVGEEGEEVVEQEEVQGEVEEEEQQRWAAIQKGEADKEVLEEIEMDGKVQRDRDQK